MKKQVKKRILSVVLCVVFVVIMMPIASSKMQVQAASNPYSGGWSNCTWAAWYMAQSAAGVELPAWSNAGTWYDSARNAGYSVGTTAEAKSIAVWTDSGNGHVGYVSEVKDNQMYIVEGGFEGGKHEGWISITAPRNYGTQTLKGFIYLGGTPQPETLGSTMSKGYDRVIPDGDYIIANSRHTDSQNQQFYYLDAKGYDVPAANSTNVQLYDDKADSIPQSDIWTVKYNDADKFYTITQKGTNMALDVYNGGNTIGTNVCVYQKSGTWGGNNQKWAITWVSDNNTHYGFRIQAKINSGYLDVYNNGNAKGTNVQLWKANASTNTSQVWEFIPYKPPQAISDGRYKIVSDLSSNLVMDVEGASSNVEDLANIQVWNYIYDKDCDAFDVKKLSNGYYSITHAASGKSLDVRGGFSNAATWRYANISMYSKHGGLNQQFAITKCNDGYIIRPRCSGLVVDVENSKTDNGTNVRQTQYWGGAAQVWKFVPYDGAPPTIKNAKVVKQTNDTVIIEADIADDVKVTDVYTSLRSVYGDYTGNGIQLVLSEYFNIEWVTSSKARFTLKGKPPTEKSRLFITAKDAAGNSTNTYVDFSTKAAKYVEMTNGQKLKLTDIWGDVTYNKDYSYYGDVLSIDNKTISALKPGTATLAYANAKTGETFIAEVNVKCGTHSWDAGVVTRAATVDADGEKTFTCSVCNGTKTEAIPKLTPGGEPGGSGTGGDTGDGTGGDGSLTQPAVVETITVNTKTVNATAINKAIDGQGADASKITTIVLGKKVKKISSGALKTFGSVKTLEVKTKKLKAKTVKGSLKGSKVKTVKVKVGSKKINKKFVKAYKKIFTKNNAGKKVTVK